MKELGKIIRIDGTKGTVQMDAKGGCKSCSMNLYCKSTGPGNRELILELGDKAYSPGDLVEIETPARTFLMAAFLVFIFPLLISMTAYFIVYTATKSTDYGLLGFFGCFVFSLFIIAWIDKKFGRKRFFEPKIVRRIR